MLKLNIFDRGQIDNFDIGLFNLELQKICENTKFGLHGDIVHLDPIEVLSELNEQEESLEKLVAENIVRDYMGWRPIFFKNRE